MSEISVILPCYNVAKFLPDCLQSLEEQTFKDFEMIFVDDGSTDNTPQVLDDFCAKHENARVIHKQNGGVSSARNEGLKNAKGEFIYFMDPDDFIDPRTLEIAYDTLKNSDADACRFGLRSVRENCSYQQVKKVSKKKVKKAKIEIDEGREKLLRMFFARKYCFSIWNGLFRHEILKKLPKYPNVFDVDFRVAQDIRFGYDFHFYAEKIIRLHLKLYFYRHRIGSTMRSKYRDDETKIMLFLEGEYQKLKDEYPKTLIYYRSFMADQAQQSICRVARGGICSENKIKKLYKTYKAGLWCCLFGRMNPYFTKLRFTELPYIWHCKNKIVRRARKGKERFGLP